MPSKPIPISEIFGPTIQGEGALIGMPTVFVRTGGCDFRCSWCDSLYAVLPQHKAEWEPHSAGHIVAKVRELAPPPMLVTISGGNPAIHNLEGLLLSLADVGYKTALETQGTRAQPWFVHLDYLTISPKPPSSKMRQITPDEVKRCIDAAMPGAPSIKVVVFHHQDYLYARSLAEALPDVPFFLQAGTPQNLGDMGYTSQDIADDILHRQQWLIDLANTDGWYTVRILPQLHVLLWGARRGV
jgi:7-carboxy-7-deazaguanine synthase